MVELSFFVPGIPRPAGSKRGFAFRRKDGKLGVALQDAAGAKGREWRAVVCDYADQALRASGHAMLEGPLSMRLEFAFPRPRCHYGRRKGQLVLKFNAPTVHTSAPDLTKLVRSVEDAMSGVVYRDDRTIVDQWAAKVYRAERPGVHVHLSHVSP